MTSRHNATTPVAKRNQFAAIREMASVERSERSVPGLPGHFDHQTIRESDRRAAAKLRDGGRNSVRILQRQVFVIHEHLHGLRDASGVRS